MMKSILQWQHVFFFPILMFARFSWLLYSWLYCNRADMPLNTKVLEKGTMLVHYCWFIGTAFWFLPSSMALTWLLVTELITGTLLGLVFVLSHNGMEVYNSSKDFVNAQVRAYFNSLQLLCRHGCICSQYLEWCHCESNYQMALWVEWRSMQHLFAWPRPDDFRSTRALVELRNFWCRCSVMHPSILARHWQCLSLAPAAYSQFLRCASVLLSCRLHQLETSRPICSITGSQVVWTGKLSTICSLQCQDTTLTKFPPMCKHCVRSMD